ncbi:MAG: opacity protein-like surface antigen [Bacteroidia bacterium]|jgi:opacity protein-like surface antigen
MRKGNLSSSVQACSCILISILFINVSSSFAQDCTDVLETAQADYDAGRFEQVISTLSQCQFASETEQWKAHRLRTMTYLVTNESDLAREEAIKMLNIHPTYKPNALTDPSELVRLIGGISIIPKFSLGLAASIGTNSTFPELTRTFSATNQVKRYSGQNSFQFGASTAYQFNQNLGVQVDVMALSKSYELDYSFGNWDLRSTEKLTYLSLPIMLRYSPTLKNRFKPYVQVGGYSSLLIGSDNSFYSTFIPENEETSLEHINSEKRRTQHDLGVVGGLGVSYKLGDGHLFIQANYYQSFVNTTNSEERFNYNELQYSYFYLDDDLKLHNLAVGIGYAIYLNYKVINKR